MVARQNFVKLVSVKNDRINICSSGIYMLNFFSKYDRHKLLKTLFSNFHGIKLKARVQEREKLMKKIEITTEDLKSKFQKC